MEAHDQLDVNGAQPAIEGAACEELIAVQFWHAGRLDEPANVAHLKFAGAWYRLYFDCGIIFWRTDGSPPKAYSAPEIEGEFRLDDIADRCSLRGCVLTSITCSLVDRGSQVALTFEGGKVVTFRCQDDRTDYTC